MSFRSLLDSTCDIKERSTTTDSMGGGGSPTWATLYRRVPCRFETLTKDLQIQAYNKKTVYPDYYVYMEYHSGIKEGMRLFKGSREFEIKLVEDWSEQGKKMKLAVTEETRST